jgi:EF-P beta-lysylation protein EpmB
MRRGDPHDPLLRQVLPMAQELLAVTGFIHDPVGDLAAMAQPGVLHKYTGRALLVTTGACAIHCRYCFRRHYPYAQAHAGQDSWTPALDHLRADASIHEVILSGGDPLALSDTKLAQLIQALDGIAHLRRLRIHTRLPVVLPARVDGPLLEWLSQGRLSRIIVLHVNHAQELAAADVVAALATLRRSGATLLNQAVLLRGVNDTAQALVALSEALFSAGVLPYYLHQLDRVQGAAHFEVPDAEALALLAEVRAHLPGYLVPRLVREVAGAPAKLPVELLQTS